MSIIDELELSVRATNVLRLMGDVETMDDFMSLTEGRVKRMRNAGRRTWNEIRAIQMDMRRQTREAEETRAAELVAEETDETVLRDWFAGKALAGLLVEGMRNPEGIAHDCYQYADAMLAARKTTKAKG